MVLENVNADENIHNISVQELLEALKPNGFLDNPGNIQKVADHIKGKTDDLTNTLKDNLTKQINDLLKQESYTADELKIINLWDKLLSQENNEIKTKLITKLDKIVNNISAEVNKKIGGNTLVNGNYYSNEQVMTIQLYANIKYGEDIKLDGQRINNKTESGILFNLDAQTPNQQLTNLYIYKQELATRGQVIDIRKEKNLLNIPNIGNLLQTLGDTEAQKKVFSEFLDFFLEVRRAGMFFENKVQGENLQLLLTNMINKEKFKDTAIDKKFFIHSDDPKDQKLIADILSSHKTMGQYFDSQVQEIKNNINKNHGINIQNNNTLVQLKQQKDLLDEIKILEEDINTLEDPIDKIKQQKELLGQKLKDNQINLSTYNEEIKKLNHEEFLLGKNMFNEKNERKDQILRYQIIEKKIAIYNMRPDNNLLTLICLDLKQYFKDSEIKQFLNQEKIKSSLDYTMYQKLIQKNTQEQQELHKRDGINDILLQYNKEGNVKLKAPSEIESIEIFSEQRKLDESYYRNGEIPPKTDGKVAKLSIPGLKDIYVNIGNKDINSCLPQEKPNKKIIYLDKSEINFTRTTYSAYPHIEELKFAYASKDKGGNLIIEDIQGKQIRTISPQEQENAQNALHKASLDVYDHDMQNTLRSFNEANTALDPLSKALEKYQSGGFFTTTFDNIRGQNYIFGEKKNGGISDSDAIETITQLKAFTSKVSHLETKVGDWKAQKAKLQEIKKQSRGLKNEFEQGIDNMIATFDQMIGFFEIKNETSQARELTASIAQINPNDKPGKAFRDWMQKDFVKMAVATALAVGAVLLCIPSGGTSLGIWATVVSAGWAGAITGTIGGMAGLRLGTMINESLHNKFNTRYTDGSLRFSDPTDIERYKKGQLSHKQFWGGLANELVIGTITTMAFIKAGGIIGNAMKNSKNNFILSFQERVGQFMLNGNTAANQNAINGFGKEFSKEFGQEMRQESLEGAGESIHPALGGLISMIACLGRPGYAKISTKLNIGGGNTVFDYNSQTVKQTFTYDSKQKSLQELQQYRETPGVKTRIENGKIIVEQNLEKPITTKDGRTIKTQIYEYIPSTASAETNNMVDILKQYNMEINHNAVDQNGNPINEVLFAQDIDPKILEQFQMQFAINGTGTITNNPDGTFTLHTTTESIIFKPSTDIQSEIEVVDLSMLKTQVDQNYNSKKSTLETQINNETDLEIKKDLTKKLGNLEKAKDKIHKVLDGEATMEDYVGIRTYAKELGLKNIETDMLPLTRKTIENHLQKINPGKNITQSDIDSYINSEINIDEVIGDIFGESFGKEQIFNGPDAKTQIMEIIQSFPTKSSDLLSTKNIETLKTYALGHIATLEAGLDLTQQQIFDIVQKNIRKAVFQNVADKGLLSGSDHGIVHIIEGNVFASWKMIDQIQGLDPKMSAKLKAMVGQIIIDHDIGYNMKAFEQMIKEMQESGNYDKEMFFEATKDHPLFSRLFLEANADHYIQIFGKENFDIMKIAMLDHSDVHSTDFSKDINGLNQGDPKAVGTALQKLISLADCMGVTHVDKLHALFKYPNMIHLLGKFEFIQQHIPSNSPEGAKLNKEVKQQMHDEINKMEQAGTIDTKTAEQYHNAVEKGMDISDNGGKNPNGFGLKFNFSSFIYSPGGYKLENNNKGSMNIGLDVDMFKVVNELYGSDVAINNLKKLIGDYGDIKIVTMGETTIQIHDKKNIKVGDQVIPIKAKQNGQDAIIEALANQIKQGAPGDIVHIETTAKDGSSIDFTINLNPKAEGNNVIYENLLTTNNKNERLNQPIKEIYQELNKEIQDQEIIQDNIIKIKESYPEIGDAIKNIIENDAIVDKKSEINKILSENIAVIYDENTSLQGPEIKNSTDILTEAENLAIKEQMQKEYKEIIQEIEINKTNPKKTKEIMTKIMEKAQNIQLKFTEITNSNKPIATKAKEYMKILHHIHLVHHVTGAIKSIVNDGKNGRNELQQKQWYSLAGYAANLTAQIVLGIAVIVPHVGEALHILTGDPSLGSFGALNGSETSLKIVSDQIEMTAEALKESMIILQQKLNIKKELQSLESAEINTENRSAMIENYKNMTKGLTSGMNIEKNEKIIKEFYSMEGYTLEINEDSDVQDIFDEILQERENNNGDEIQHRENIHKLVGIIKPGKELQNVVKTMQYNMLKKQYSTQELELREPNGGEEQREHALHALHIGH